MEAKDLVGKKVRRGKDWSWGNQDGIPTNWGVIVGMGNLPGWVQVTWSGLSPTYDYRMGAHGLYDLEVLDEVGTPAPVASVKTTKKLGDRLSLHLERGELDVACMLVLSNTKALFGEPLKPAAPKAAPSKQDLKALSLLKKFPEDSALTLASILACYLPAASELPSLIQPVKVVDKGKVTPAILTVPYVMLKSPKAGLIFYTKTSSIRAVTLHGGGNYEVDLNTATIPTKDEVRAFLVLREEAILQELAD